MSEEYILMQVKVYKECQPEVFEHLNEIRSSKRCEAVRMLMQQAFKDKELIDKVLAAMPLMGMGMGMAPPQAYQAAPQSNKEGKKEDLSFLDDISFTPGDDFGELK